jgi:type IV pilus assembly protein PilM
MKVKSFGLDIGTTSIKSVSLKNEGNKFSVEAIAVSPFTAKSILSESQLNQQTIASSIHEMLGIAQIKTKSVNVSIPASQVYTKIIETPELSEKELAASLSFEMEQYIPLPLNQVKTDWQILDHFIKDGQKTMSVLIIAASTSVLEKYENILTLSGLVPSSVETEMISVQRALSPLFTPSETCLVVHLGSSSTNITITAGGVLRFIATIGLGGLAITRAISSDLGIATSQAEELKKTYGLTNTLEGKIGSALRPVLDAIIADIKRAILTYKEKNKNALVNKVVLSGGTALLPGIEQFFTESLGLTTTVGNTFVLHRISNVPEEVLQEAPSYNVVVGLALRDIVI